MRRVQEQRLADTVLEAVRAGQKVLIPAFALGRAQEVLLILRQALARPDAPDMTVYVDGMVRRVCGVYCQHVEALSPKLRRRAESGRDLFYTADGKVRAVESAKMRGEILDGPPCVIVSSSGMLAGGPSTWYAKHLAGNEQALITITGYQDEEAPGRRLQEIAAGESKHLVLDGARVPVCCRVETYALSAHADAQELAGLVTAMGPKAVALVHGDEAARRGLADRFAEHKLRDVYLPSVGETLEFDFAPASKKRMKPGMGEGRTLDETALETLHQHLWEAGPRGRTYSAGDLAEAWYGTEGVPHDLTGIHDLATSAPRLFMKDHRHAFLYRLADPDAPAPAGSPGKANALTPDGLQQTGSLQIAPPRDEAGRIEQNAALALADALLGPESGLYRKGADRETWRLKLYFHFPDRARQKHLAALEDLAAQTGWAVELHPHPHMGSLEQAARDLLGSCNAPLRTPSVNMHQRQVAVMVEALPAEEEGHRISERFEEKTGYTLLFKSAPQGTPAAKQITNSEGRMEINAMYAYVDHAFADQDPQVRPLRKSLKREGCEACVELSFITPEIGARAQELIEILEKQTGWPIRIADRVDQQTVLRILKELIPAHWELLRGPGLDVPARKVTLRLAVEPPASEREALDERLKERTGFRL
ncbi:MAG: MBL fold metallo-hydrolase [Planctomycetota bacterium]